MLDWIKTWTFFNWLAIIAFSFSCISVLNALFGLRSRYKDWRAIRSKQAFDKRLAQLKEHFSDVRALQKSATYLLAEIGFRLFGILFLLMIAVGYVVIIIINIALAGGVKRSLLFDVGIFLIVLIPAVITAINSLNLMNHVSHPRILGEKAIELINRGKGKGFLPKDDTATANYFIENDMFAKSTQDYLRTLAENPKALKK